MDKRHLAVIILVVSALVAASGVWALSVPAGLGDRVWYDANEDGYQSTDLTLEPGISGVTVTLTGTLANGTPVNRTMLTGNNGKYWFGYLGAGTFTVSVSTPAGHEPTWDLGEDHDANTALVSPNTTTVALVTNQLKYDVDFGFVVPPPPPCQLGDRVWFDTDSDGIQDSGEAGINGATVTLSGPVSSTQTTSGDGNYLFTNLPAGTYTVTVSGYPANYTQTWDYDGAATADVAAATLTAGETNLDVDFGYVDETANGGWTTYSVGGWGGRPNGNNAGARLHANFATLYPNGLRIGGYYVLHFTSAQAITDFLPGGGSAGVLTHSYVDPVVKTEGGNLASQALATKLSVDFSSAGITASGLGGLHITSGPYQGWTVYQLLAEALRTLGGDTENTVGDAGELAAACAAINLNYDNGTQDLGYLAP